MSKFRILTGIALASALFIGSACSDEWDNHYEDKGVNSNQTILEIINSDSELDNFRAVLDACGVTDSLLNQSRVYTLWAPVIDARMRDSLLSRVNDGARDTVLTRFIKSHMSDYMYAANGKLQNNRVRLLNDKVVRFDGSAGEYTFGGVPLRMMESNVRARNGVIHKIDGAAGYSVSVWEYLAQDSRLDSLRKYLYSFDRREFSEYASIAGPIVDGQQTYIDSVFVNSNIWFGRIGYIATEDSSYSMFALTNNVWEKWVPIASKSFNYYRALGEEEYYDSLQHQNARVALCSHLVFNQNDQTEELGDTIRSTQSSKLGLYGKFIREKLIDGVIDSVELSNGKVYIMDELTYSPYDLWLDTLKIDLWTNSNTALDNNGRYAILQDMYVMQNVQNPEIPGHLYLSDYLYAKAETSTSNPQLAYKMPGVLSGKYKVGVVVIPPHISNPNYPVDKIKPSKIMVQIKSRAKTGSGTTTLYNTENGYTVRFNIGKGIVNDPTRIDTVYLHDVALDKTNKGDLALREPAIIEFNRCETGIGDINDIKTEITLQSNLKAGDVAADWDRDLRIDCILLVPVLDEE